MNILDTVLKVASFVVQTIALFFAIRKARRGNGEPPI